MLETEFIAGHAGVQPAVAQAAIAAGIGKSRLVNRNVTATTGRTSMRLEPEVWDAIREICLRDDIDLGEMIKRVEKTCGAGGRTSAVRVFVLQYFRAAATDEGHQRAGHGPDEEGYKYSSVHGASLRLPD